MDTDEHPIAALVIAGIAVKEGHKAWQGIGWCANRLPQPPRKPSPRTGAAADRAAPAAREHLVAGPPHPAPAP
ncbi:hypothetical protein ACWD00_31235 [Streptomyces viridiviolaceus]